MVHLIAELPAPGGYLSIVKILGLLALTIPWLYAGPWVYADTREVHTRRQLWSAVVLATGTAGIVLWLLLPLYLLGMAAFVILALAGLAAYVVHRNSRVSPERRILTGEHLAGLFSGQRTSREEIVTRLKLYGANGKIRFPPDAETASEDEVHAWNLAQDLLHDVIWRRASEVDLLPTTHEMELRLVIDGVVTKQPGMSLEDGEAVIQFLKPLAGLDADDRRRPQQGHLSVDLASKPIDIMVATAGSTSGQRLQFKIVQEAVRTKIDELGMSEEILGKVRSMARAHGLILVSGAAHNGVTSTMYSLIRDQDAFTKQIDTLESTPAIDLENITQHAYGLPAKLPDAVASVLRRDPDMIMVDALPTGPPARQLAEYAEGRTVLIGDEAPDTFRALADWVKACGDPELAVRHLHGVLCQTLIRTLCERCKEPYRPDPQLLAKANLPAGKIDKFFRPPSNAPMDDKGRTIVCSACQGTGFYGRTAAFELLEITDEIREMVASNASLRDIKAAARRKGMLYLQEQALRKVIGGQTSVQEVLRVSQPKKTSTPSAK